MPRFMVLRNAAAVMTSSPFENLWAGTAADTFTKSAARVPPEPRMELLDLSVREAASLARDPQVGAVAEPMPTTLITPFDAAAAAAGDAWGIAAVGADTSSCTGAGVVVAVLDTGIDKTHPAFAGMALVEKDFTGSGDGDRRGHGTHCAGTIFGRDIGGARIGVARGVTKALIGKTLDDAGNGTSDMISSGILWALDQGAHVISMSLGFDFPGAVKKMTDAGVPAEPAISAALETYRSNLRYFDTLMQMVQARAPFREAAVIVAATGNESDRPAFTIAASLPAAAQGVVSVAALGRDGDGKFDIAKFSNTMAQLAAPGVGILSAKAGGGLATKSGTSMACPHVAGVAALWWESLKKSGAVTPSANLVVHNLIARARTDVLTDSLTVADRGTGIVTAPP